MTAFLFFFVGVLSKLFGGSKTSFDLKGEIKKLMLVGEAMKRVTNKAGTFTLVMSSFSQYERLVSM